MGGKLTRVEGLEASFSLRPTHSLHFCIETLPRIKSALSTQKLQLNRIYTPLFPPPPLLPHRHGKLLTFGLSPSRSFSLPHSLTHYTTGILSFSLLQHLKTILRLMFQPLVQILPLTRLSSSFKPHRQFSGN